MTRPWVTPAEVKAYSDMESVQNRPDTKLRVDIMRAEEYVIAYTHNDFSDVAYATSIPASVKTAIILLAEAYANAAVTNAATSKQISKTGAKSESFDDYSYTAADGISNSEIDASNLGLSSLLDGYVLSTAKGNVFFRMRKL